MRTILPSTAAVGCALAVTLAGCGGTTTSKPSTVTQTVTTQVTPQAATPNYFIVAKTIAKTSDSRNYYYLVIDPVHRYDDSFKQTVKLVLQAVAKTDGGANFYAEVYDDEAAANAGVSHKDHLGDLTPQQKLAHGDHFVAVYFGGLDKSSGQTSNADSASYEIIWYPSGTWGSPMWDPYLKQYVGQTEQWKP